MRNFLPIILALLANYSLAQSNQDMIQIMRSDINTSKLTILSEAMQLTPAQAEKFWPIQREYASQVDTLRDKRLAIVRDYADNFAAMTDHKANQLAQESFAIQRQLQALKQEVFEKMSRDVSTITAFRFIQADAQIETLIDLRLSQQIPLISAPGDSNEDQP